MKKVLISLSLIALTSASVFGQANDRTSGIMAFKAYGDNPTDPKAINKLNEAKEYLDKAYNAGFQEEPRTNYYRGMVYIALASEISKKYAGKPAKGASVCMGDENAPKPSAEDQALIAQYAEEMVKSFKVAYSKKTKKDDFSSEINTLVIFARVQAVTCGNENYNAKKYDRALEFYSEGIRMQSILGQLDTMATYNRGLCYERLQKYDLAMADFITCASTGYNGADVYRLIFETAAAAGKLEEAGKYLKEGRAKYPKEQNLVLCEVNYYLGSGKNVEAEKAINEALSNDPKNPLLYFALGNTYDNLANPRDDKGKELTKPANFQELSKKAEDSYKKAIEFKPDYFDALYNLGVLKYNEGAEYMTRIKDIADNTEYEKEKAKADEKFAAALPHLEKARSVNPKDRDNLRMLKVIYTRLGNTEKVTEINEALKN